MGSMHGGALGWAARAWGCTGSTHPPTHTPRLHAAAEFAQGGQFHILEVGQSPLPLHVTAEFAQGELFEILEDDQSLPEDVVQGIAKQLVRALHYLHSNRIIHR